MNHPFDITAFIKDNRELIKKYLKKDTMGVVVDDIVVSPDHWYQRNQNILRGGGASFEYSLAQKLEYVKCMKDVAYFAKKYVKIISIDEGVINFNLYDYQEELLKIYQNNRFSISMQARQTGKTQTTATYLLHFASFNPAKGVAILANKAVQAREILSRVQMSYEYLPYFLKRGVLTYNKGSMMFDNKSEIFCGSSSSSSIRGKSIALLYIDECAFLRGDMEFYESTYPTISSGRESRIIITSTPNGSRGLFHKLWTESEQGLNLFARMCVPWDKVPGRDLEWKLEQISNTSQEQFDQEHGLKFRGSQNSLLAGHVLDSLPKFKPIGIYGDLKVYDEPKQDHQYFVTVDTSRGVGKDYSAFVVFDITQMPYEVVAVYRNNRISPMVYPQMIRSIADKYNKAYVMVEINDIGEQVASILYYDFEYENQIMCYSQKNVQSIGFVGDARLGVRTTMPVKSIGCSNVKTLIETGKLVVKDHDIVEEFGTFVPKGRSYEADEGANDDLAMCCVLFAWATGQQYFIDLTDKDVRANVRESTMEELMNDIMPFGIIDNGIEEFSGYNPITDKTSSEFGTF